MKALNSWARFAGYSDFDTFIRTGGSIQDARRDISARIKTLELALTALDSQTAAPEVIHEADSADSDNAHIQGADQ